MMHVYIMSSMMYSTYLQVKYGRKLAWVFRNLWQPALPKLFGLVTWLIGKIIPGAGIGTRIRRAMMYLKETRLWELVRRMSPRIAAQVESGKPASVVGSNFLVSAHPFDWYTDSAS